MNHDKLGAATEAPIKTVIAPRPPHGRACTEREKARESGERGEEAEWRDAEPRQKPLDPQPDEYRSRSKIGSPRQCRLSECRPPEDRPPEWAT